VRLAAATTGTGEAIAAFSNTRPTGGGHATWIATRNGMTGAWSAPENVAPATYRSGEPSVAIAENGLAILTWGDAYGPQWSRRAPDRTWSVPAAVDDLGGLYTGSTDVAMDAAGNAIVALGSFDDTYTYRPLRASKLAANSNRFAPPTLLTSLGSTISSFQIAASPQGTFVVGWVDTEYDTIAWRPVGAGVNTLAPGSGWRRQAFGSGDEAIAAAAATGTGIVLWNSATTTPSTVRASSASIR
jgi:hypothetical protein